MPTPLSPDAGVRDDTPPRRAGEGRWTLPRQPGEDHTP